MSLRYIIDGCNITHHPTFKKINNSRNGDLRLYLVELIRQRRLCGSSRNKALVVFDGYAQLPGIERRGEGLGVVFSCGISADEYIKMVLEKSGSQKNTVVVSDDKQVSLFARLIGAKAQGVEEFLARGDKGDKGIPDEESKLSYAQMDKINRELRNLWLK